MDLYALASQFEVYATQGDDAIKAAYDAVSKQHMLGPFWRYVVSYENGKPIVTVSPTLPESMQNFVKSAVVQLQRSLPGVEVRVG